MANNGNSIFEYLIINCGFFRFLLSLHELTYQFFKRCKEFIFHTTNVGDYRSVLLHPLLLKSNGRISAMINDNRDTALIIGSTRSGDKTEEINGRGSSAEMIHRSSVVMSSCLHAACGGKLSYSYLRTCRWTTLERFSLPRRRSF